MPKRDWSALDAGAAEIHKLKQVAGPVDAPPPTTTKSEGEVARLRGEVDRQRAENARLRAMIAELEAGTTRPEPPQGRPDKDPSKGSETKGSTAYNAKRAGKSWTEIEAAGVKSAKAAARSHARTHVLPWPPAPSE